MTIQFPCGLPKRVVVVGAGISGMTAAHELMERGYDVEVVEVERDDQQLATIDSTAVIRVAPAIGGMARTSWARAPLPPVRAPTVFVEAEAPAASSDSIRSGPRPLARHECALPWEGYRYLLSDEPRSKWPAELVVELDRFKKAMDADASLQLRISVVSRDSEPAVEDLVEGVVEAFGIQLDRIQLAELKRDLVPVESEPFTTPEGFDPADLVQFSAAVDRIPAEHGFRFFPSFYRNLFDSMKRIPLAESAPVRSRFQAVATRDSARTVFDNLVSAEDFRLGLPPFRGRARTYDVPRRKFNSIREIRVFFHNTLERAGYRGADLQRLALKYAKYLTSCDARRLEYERISWGSFLELESDEYSEYFVSHVESAAQALVAMSSEKNDARTVGSVAMQLTLDQFAPGSYSDGTLNGPTSVSFLYHWRDHLQNAGVRFTCGELVGFEIAREADQALPACLPVIVDKSVVPQPEAEPTATPTNEAPSFVRAADYYVITIPVDKWQALIGETPGEFDGIALASRQQLLDVNEKCLLLDRLEGRGPWEDAVLDEPSDVAKYFDFELNCATVDAAPDQGPLRYMVGIQFYFESDVKLIRGHVMLQDSPWGVSYLSQAGYWQETRSAADGFRGVISVILTRFEEEAFGRDDGGTESWRAAKDCSPTELADRVWRQIAESWDTSTQGPLPQPESFYLDANLEWNDGSQPGTRRGYVNHTPYLVNHVPQWENRPGERLPDGSYRYRVQLGHSVFAGVFMRTSTRLNTMEAACESGRRAVNAILEYDENASQRCQTFDLEDHEPEDLKSLRELDARIHRRGGEHTLDSPFVEATMRMGAWDLGRLFVTSKEGV